MLDWLVVGGGIHGVHLAVRLLAERGVKPSSLRIVDPGERLVVSGPLAELELGPVARNIIGARRAGERLIAS